VGWFQTFWYAILGITREELTIFHRISRSQGLFQWMQARRGAQFHPKWNSWSFTPSFLIQSVDLFPVWAEKGVVGRGVLLDYCSWAESEGKLLPALETSSITISDLEKAAEYQGVTFNPGDILFVRSGFDRALDAMTKDEAVAYSARQPNGIGVKACEETLKWIWDHEFSAVAGDAIAFEA